MQLFDFYIHRQRQFFIIVTLTSGGMWILTFSPTCSDDMKKESHWLVPHTLSTQLLLTRRLPGLMSRCRMPAEWRYLRPGGGERERQQTRKLHQISDITILFSSLSFCIVLTSAHSTNRLSEWAENYRLLNKLLSAHILTIYFVSQCVSDMYKLSCF